MKRIHFSKRWGITSLLACCACLRILAADAIPVRDLQAIAHAFESVAESVVPVGEAQERLGGAASCLSAYSALLIDGAGKFYQGKHFATATGPVSTVLILDLKKLASLYEIKLQAQLGDSDQISFTMGSYVIAFNSAGPLKPVLYRDKLVAIDSGAGSVGFSELGDYTVTDKNTKKTAKLYLLLSNSENQNCPCLDEGQLESRKTLIEQVRKSFDAPSRQVRIRKDGDRYSVGWAYSVTTKLGDSERTSATPGKSFLGDTNASIFSFGYGNVFFGLPEKLASMESTPATEGKIILKGKLSIGVDDDRCYAPFFAGFYGDNFCLIPLECHPTLSHVPDAFGGLLLGRAF